MRLYHYIHTVDKSEDLAFTTSAKKLSARGRRIQLTKKDMQKYRLHIKYIDCCSLDKDLELEYDEIKVLAKRLDELSRDIDFTERRLRQTVVEAAAVGKTDLANDISQTIKSLNEFINSDFSNISDIQEIDTLTCPELHIDYEQYYTNKIYGV